MFFNTFWFAIDFVLIIFLMPFMRNAIKGQGNEVWQRSVNKISTQLDMLEIVTKELGIVICMSIVFYILLTYQSDEFLKGLLEWCKGTLVVAFLPPIISFVHDSAKINGQGWHTSCIVLGIVISIIGYTNFENKNIFCVLLAVFISLFVISLYKILSKQGKKVLKIGKGIRKDLYNRTCSIDLNMSKTELIRKMESFVSEYLKKYSKINDLRGIEYVTLLDVHREEWYKRVKKRFIVLMTITLIVCSLETISLSQLYPLTCVGLIVFFVIIIYILKHKDKEYLYKMAIRFWYSEWGYCLYFSDNCKFVGAVQLYEFGKKNRYIHALLDYIAYIRVVYTEDEVNQTENLKMLSRNLALLYKDYAGSKEIDWIKSLPLWIIAFYEYLLFGVIGSETMARLECSIKITEDWKQVNIFMQSFAVDLFRRMPNESDLKLVKNFIEKVKTCRETL